MFITNHYSSYPKFKRGVISRYLEIAKNENYKAACNNIFQDKQMLKDNEMLKDNDMLGDKEMLQNNETVQRLSTTRP